MTKTTTQGILEDTLSELKNGGGPGYSPTSADASGREIEFFLLTLRGFFRGSSFLDLIPTILLMSIKKEAMSHENHGKCRVKRTKVTCLNNALWERRNSRWCRKSIGSSCHAGAAWSECCPCRTPLPGCPAQRLPHQKPENIKCNSSQLKQILSEGCLDWWQHQVYFVA